MANGCLDDQEEEVEESDDDFGGLPAFRKPRSSLVRNRDSLSVTNNKAQRKRVSITTALGDLKKAKSGNGVFGPDSIFADFHQQQHQVQQPVQQQQPRQQGQLPLLIDVGGGVLGFANAGANGGLGNGGASGNPADGMNEDVDMDDANDSMGIGDILGAIVKLATSISNGERRMLVAAVNEGGIKATVRLNGAGIKGRKSLQSAAGKMLLSGASKECLFRRFQITGLMAMI